jgi:hypothetical protein
MMVDAPPITPTVEEIIMRAAMSATPAQIGTEKRPAPFPERPNSQQKKDEKK